MRLDIPFSIGDTAYFLLDETDICTGTVKQITVKDNDLIRITIDFGMPILDVNLATLGTRLFFDEKEAKDALEGWKNGGAPKAPKKV